MSLVPGALFPRLSGTNPRGCGCSGSRGWAVLGALVAYHFPPWERQEAAHGITTEPSLLRAAGASMALWRCWDWLGG